jgi:hypothetical protein
MDRAKDFLIGVVPAMLDIDRAASPVWPSPRWIAALVLSGTVSGGLHGGRTMVVIETLRDHVGREGRVRRHGALTSAEIADSISPL